jgi:hypothetical protein
VNAPPNYKSAQLFKFNLTFCVVWVFQTSGSFNANFDAKFIEKHPLLYIAFIRAFGGDKE